MTHASSATTRRRFLRVAGGAAGTFMASRTAKRAPAGRQLEVPLCRSDRNAAELFNLDLDPAEQYNVYSRNRDRGEVMMKQIQKFAAELKIETHQKARA